MKIEAFLRESPLVAITRASRTLETQLSRRFQEKGLSFSAALILVSIFFEEPKRVTPSQLGEILSMTRGNVSHCLSSLEAQGLLGRRIDPEDARSYQLLLKPQGKKAAMQVVRILHRMQTSFEKSIGTAQLKAMLAGIQQLERACEPLEE